MEWGRDRAAGGTTARLLAAVLLALAALLIPRAATALDPIDLATLAAARELGPALGGLTAEKRNVEVELPAAPGGGTPAKITLTALGPGPTFNWVVAAISNTASTPREAVISVPLQGFSGSGFLPLRFAGPRIYSVQAGGAAQIEVVPVPSESAYLLTLPPGGRAAVAFELLEPGPLPVTIWQREAFDGRKDYLSFFRGALLGVSVLLAVALFGLYGFRARGVFPVAGGFALTCIAFMLLEGGHLPGLLAQLPLPGLDPQVVRAVVEGLMAAFLLLLLGFLSDLQRVSRTAGSVLLALGGLAFMLPVYGLADPIMATMGARALFVATALGGFVLINVLWRMNEVKPETALLSWGAVVIWTILAVAAALADNTGPAMPAILVAGLAAVLVVIGFALAHFAFSQGYLSRHFFREAGRHALALAGARAYVWDWQPEEGELYVSPEIARALAQPPDVLEGAASEAFLEIMHPSDRSAYLATVEEAALDGRMPIERQFRLRHGEGGYRWFELRARSITGHGLRAARCIGTMIDVTSAKLAEERLLDDAVHDVITGLPNRALFVDRLERALLAQGAGQAGGLFVLLVELDRFRLVSDAFGHETADALLAVTARRLKSETGLADSIARLPGAQFVILFRELPGRRDVERLADALSKTVARPITLDEREFTLTASIGIAPYPGEAVAAERLMRNAAVALHEAKRRGSATVELFAPDMVNERAELVLREVDMRRGLERNEFEVHYQPIARLADMNLAGFEALVRWRHPKHGLLAPESFLGLAEETGMIRDIGRIVLNEAGRNLGIWQRAYRGAEPAYLAVNLTSSQLIAPDMLDDVKQIVNREGLRRGSFKVEVTESLVMQHPERAQQILERLRDLGAGLSCDDFGTGYSSLSSLRRLPFDTIKVDRSFIAREGTEQRGWIILESVIAMGHALGLTVVADGIETQEQVDRLGLLGCDQGQGFLIGKPLTVKQVSDALAGLPYASSSGRTAITWLWERSQKDPPPQARARSLSGPEQPLDEMVRKVPKLRHEPDAPSAPPPEAEAPDLPEPASPPPPAEEPPSAEEPAPAPDEEPAETPPGPGPDKADDEPREAAAGLHADVPSDDDEGAPPPAPRRRKRQRRAPVLDMPEE